MTKHFLSNFYDEYSYGSEKFEALNQFYVKLGTDLLNLATSSNTSSYLGSIETYKYMPAQYIDIRRAKYQVKDIVESYEFGEIISGPQMVDKEAAWREMSAKDKASILDKTGRFIQLNGIYPGTEDIVERADVLGFEVFSEYGRQLIRNVDYFFHDNRFYLLKSDKLPLGSNHLLFKDIAIDINMPERKFIDKIKIPYNSTLTKNEYNEMAYALVRIALGGFTVGNLNKALSFIGEAEGGVFAYDRLTAPEDKKHLWGDEPDNDDPYKHLRSPLTRFDFVVSAPVGEEGTRRMDIVRAFMNRLRLKHTSFVIVPRMSIVDEYDLGLMDDELFMKLYWHPWDEMGDMEDIISLIKLTMFRGDGIFAEGDDACVGGGAIPIFFDDNNLYDSGLSFDSGDSSKGYCSNGECPDGDYETAEDNGVSMSPWCQIGVLDNIQKDVRFNFLIDNIDNYDDEVTLSGAGMKFYDYLSASDVMKRLFKTDKLLIDGFTHDLKDTASGLPEFDNYFGYDYKHRYDTDVPMELIGDSQFVTLDELYKRAEKKLKTVWSEKYGSSVSLNTSTKFEDEATEISSSAVLDLINGSEDGFGVLVGSEIYDGDVARFDVSSTYDSMPEISDSYQFFAADDNVSVGDKIGERKFGEVRTRMYNEVSDPDAVDSIDSAEDAGIRVVIKDKETGEEREVDL